MPESKHVKLTGQIVSVEKGDRYTGGPSEVAWVDLAVKLIEGHIINIHYTFPRVSIRDNILNAVKNGMTITVSVAGEADPDRKFEYQGIGAIQIYDLSNELDRYVREKFRTTEKDYFTEREVAFIKSIIDYCEGSYTGDI